MFSNQNFGAVTQLLIFQPPEIIIR